MAELPWYHSTNYVKECISSSNNIAKYDLSDINTYTRYFTTGHGQTVKYGINSGKINISIYYPPISEQTELEMKPVVEQQFIGKTPASCRFDIADHTDTNIDIRPTCRLKNSRIFTYTLKYEKQVIGEKGDKLPRGILTFILGDIVSIKFS